MLEDRFPLSLVEHPIGSNISYFQTGWLQDRSHLAQALPPSSQKTL